MLLKGLSDICIGTHLQSYIFTTTPDLPGVIGHRYIIGISGHDSQFHHEESALSPEAATLGANRRSKGLTPLLFDHGGRTAMPFSSQGLAFPHRQSGFSVVE